MIENLQFIQTPAQQLCEDFELCRVWDSLVYEDDQEDEFQIGLEASGAMDETQTRQILYLDLIVSYLYVSFWWTSSQTHQLSLSLPWWSGKLQLLERSENWQRVLAWLQMGGLWLHQNLPHKMVKSVPKMLRNRKPSNKPLLRRFQHAVHAYQKSVHGIPNAKIHLCNLVQQICT